MISSVTDVSGNRPDKIANAVNVIGNSKDRLQLFSTIYSGKKVKTVTEIFEMTNLKTKIRVLQEGKKLISEDMVNEIKKDGKIAYGKIDFYTQNKSKILSLVKNKEKFRKYPTKTNPQGQNSNNVTIHFNKNQVQIKYITIDAVDSFSKSKSKKESDVTQTYEEDIKEIFKNTIGETGKFSDWGGETSDLYSTRLKIKGKLFRAAFAFKGRGTKGILTPKKMGKNGDQIQRLFKSSAEVFFVQHVDQIAESIMEQMKTHAAIKSIQECKKIYYGIIDGKDTSRIIAAYGKNK